MLVRKLKQLIKGIQRELLLPSLLLILPSFLFIYETQDIPFHDFNRLIGLASINNIDVDARARFITQWMFFILPLLFLFVWILLSNICVEKYKKRYQNLSLLSVAAAIPIVYYSTQLSDTMLHSYLLVVMFLPITITLLFLIPTIKPIQSFFEKNNDIYLFSVISSFPLYIFLLQQKSLNDLPTVTVSVDDIIRTVFIYFCFILMFVLAIYYLGIFLRQKKLFHFFQHQYKLTLFLPLFVLIVLEILNIFSYRGINFRISNEKFVTILYIIVFLFPFVMTFLFRRSKKVKRSNFIFTADRYFLYIVIVLSFMAFTPQNRIMFETTVSGEPFRMMLSYFEEANAGNSIYGLLYHGKIPMVETFDAHFLYFQIGKVLYFLASGDKQSALVYGYSVIPIFLICYYVLFKRIFGLNFSFFLFLFSSTILSPYFIEFAGIAPMLLVMDYANKKNKYVSYGLLWLLSAFLLVYRLDTGAAILVGTIVTWFIYCLILEKGPNKLLKIKKIVFPFIIVYSALFILFCFLCIVKLIDPIQRIREILGILQSNNFWGYASLGNNTLIAYLCYYVLPFISSVMLINIIFKKRVVEKENIILVFGLILSFVVFYINFSRGLIRHTLIEMTLVNLSGTFLLFCYFYFRIIKSEQKYKQMLLIVVGPLALNLLVSPNVVSWTPIYHNINRYTEEITTKIQRPLKKGEERISYSEDIEAIVRPLKYVFDQTLESDETFLDFSNQSSLYFLLKRENFMYVNQSPGLLSGEMTQQAFIKSAQMNKKRIPYAITSENMLFGPSMDGLNTSYRHYLVAEYMYMNYIPIYKTNNFVIWAEKERSSDKIDKIKQINTGNQVLKDAGLERISYEASAREMHYYTLGLIPFLWANYDKKNMQQTVQKVFIEGKPTLEKEMVFELNTVGINKEKGNYLYLELGSEAEMKLLDVDISILDMNTNENLATFTFSTSKEGKQKYCIRVSSDMYWYAKDKLKIKLKTTLPVGVQKFALLEGDTLNEL